MNGVFCMHAWLAHCVTLHHLSLICCIVALLAICMVFCRFILNVVFSWSFGSCFGLNNWRYGKS